MTKYVIRKKRNEILCNSCFYNRLVSISLVSYVSFNKARQFSDIQKMPKKHTLRYFVARFQLLLSLDKMSIVVVPVDTIIYMHFNNIKSTYVAKCSIQRLYFHRPCLRSGVVLSFSFRVTKVRQPSFSCTR